MNIRTAITMIGRRFWIVALCTLVAAGTAAFVNTQIAPEYEATTKLAVNQISPEGSLTNYDNILANELLAKSYAETLTSRSILTEVIARLGLPISPGRLNDSINIYLIPQTQLMNLTITANDPQQAADIANTIVVVFREQNRSLLLQRYSVAREGIESELALARGEVDLWSETVDRLRDSNFVPLEQLRDAEFQLNQARNNYATLSEAIAKLRIAETQVVDNIDVIEPAFADDEPVWPDPMLNLVVASVAGAIVGCFIALFLGDLALQKHAAVPESVASRERSTTKAKS